MKIYIASSWKMKEGCRILATNLRLRSHTVDLFCEEPPRRTVFNFADILSKTKDHTGISVLKEPMIVDAFKQDKKWIDWADAIILVLPSGRSAHLEAGYAKGKGKHLWIIGDFPIGEFDLMYGFADGLFKWGDFMEMCKEIEGQEINQER